MRLFSFCSYRHFDMAAYEAYFAGKLQKHEMTQAEIDDAIAHIDAPEVGVS